METIAGVQRSFASDVWLRFRKRNTAVAGVVIVVILILFATLGPLLTGHTYSDQNLSFVNIPTVFTGWKLEESADSNFAYITQNLKLIEASKKGRLLGPIPVEKEDPAKKRIIFDYRGKQVSLDYSDKTRGIRVVDSSGSELARKRIINKSYVLGTDSLGRDLLTS